MTGGACLSQSFLALQPCRTFAAAGHETLTLHLFLQLFRKQGDFFDIPASNLTPLQVRENLAKIAAEVIPSDAVEEFRELLKLKGSPNGGVAVTDDLKYTSACWSRPFRLVTIDLIGHSQILAAERHPRVANCLVGRVGSRRDFQ